MTPSLPRRVREPGPNSNPCPWLRSSTQPDRCSVLAVPRAGGGDDGACMLLMTLAFVVGAAAPGSDAPAGQSPLPPIPVEPQPEQSEAGVAATTATTTTMTAIPDAGSSSQSDSANWCGEAIFLARGAPSKVRTEVTGIAAVGGGGGHLPGKTIVPTTPRDLPVLSAVPSRAKKTHL